MRALFYYWWLDTKLIINAGRFFKVQSVIIIQRQDKLVVDVALDSKRRLLNYKVVACVTLETFDSDWVVVGRKPLNLVRLKLVIHHCKVWYIWKSESSLGSVNLINVQP